MECEILQSPMISYLSLLYSTTVLYDSSSFHTYLMTLLCVCVCISCNSVFCGCLSVCLCVITEENIDQAGGPETF